MEASTPATHRRRRRVPRTYHELIRTPSTLEYDGQTLELETRIWRECNYRDLEAKDQDKDLSGLHCVVRLVPPFKDIGLCVKRIWVINCHDCRVFTSRAVHVNRGGPGGLPACCAVCEGPCWELCSCCDVVVQLVNDVTGQHVGLLRAPDQVVSAEVVFSKLDLARVIMRLMAAALHLLVTRTLAFLASHSTRFMRWYKGRSTRRPGSPPHAARRHARAAMSSSNIIIPTGSKTHPRWVLTTAFLALLTAVITAGGSSLIKHEAVFSGPSPVSSSLPTWPLPEGLSSMFHNSQPPSQAPQLLQSTALLYLQVCKAVLVGLLPAAAGVAWAVRGSRGPGRPAARPVS
mmetsp:Transcript_11221/g.24174  ORF Transcript_11221/g.24174 Transcript_11221/m.24174 type:complete len:346 (-) Transcript_11221:1188-2225(-)